MSVNKNLFIRKMTTIGENNDTSGIINLNNITLITTPVSDSSATINTMTITSNLAGTSNFTNSCSGISSNMNSSTTGISSSIFGIKSRVLNNGTGTINTSALYQGTITNTSTGTISLGLGLLVESPVNSGGGVINNAIGVYINDQSGTGIGNGWGMYQLGENTNNYFAGKLGIGSTPTASTGLLYLKKNYTDETSVQYPFYNNLTQTPTSNSTALIRCTTTVLDINGTFDTGVHTANFLGITHNSSGTSSLLYGTRCGIFNAGTGTVNTIRGYISNIANQSTGNIGSITHILINTPSNSAGTIGNVYGLWIYDQDPTGTSNAYGVFQQGIDTRNYFEGYTGIGVAGVNSAMLRIRGTSNNDIAGTVSVVISTPTVTGSGTSFTSLKVGQAFKIVSSGGSSVLYTIKTIASNTSLTLTINYTGASESGLIAKIDSTYLMDVEGDNSSNKFVVRSDGRSSFGAEPTDVRLLVLDSDEITNDISEILHITHSLSDTTTEANGIGTRIGFGTTTNTGTDTLIAGISAVCTDVTTNASDLLFETDNGTTLTEQMRITSAGALNVAGTATSTAILLTNTTNQIILDSTNNAVTITTATQAAARTLTIPVVDASDSFVTKTSTDTLTNKKLISKITNNGDTIKTIVLTDDEIQTFAPTIDRIVKLPSVSGADGYTVKIVQLTSAGTTIITKADADATNTIGGTSNTLSITSNGHASFTCVSSLWRVNL
jgi:hypothetical protein